MRVGYWDIFERTSGGAITPRKRVSVGGATMGPGVVFTVGVSFGGLDLAAAAGKDLDVTTNPDGSVQINGVFG